MRGKRLVLIVVIILVFAVTLALRAHSMVRQSVKSTRITDRIWDDKRRSPPAPSSAPRPPQQPPDKPRAKMSSTFERFHGFYSCQVGTPCPSYSAGFLTSRAQLLSNPVTTGQMRRKNTNMETASYHIMGSRGRYDVYRTVDGLDFAVEHLSMYERMIQASKIPGERETPSPLAAALYETFVERLRRYEAHLKRKCSGDVPVDLDPEGARTVGVMPYYAFGGAGSGHTRFESKALYLNITIRSIRCHFGAVAVSCLHPGDRAYLEAGRGLPHIDHVLWVDPADLAVYKPSILGIATIRAVEQRWTEENSTWARNYEYFYYTEADQILHLRPRHRRKLYKCLGNSEKGRLGVLTPHRLNALPRAQDFALVDKAFATPDLSGVAPDEARADRAARWGLDAAYEPRADPWYRQTYGDPNRGAFVRRELDGYGGKRLTRLGDDLADGSCCYLRRAERAYPYDIRGKAAGVRLDDVRAGQFGALENRSSPVELLAVGDHGLGILAGLCCHICPRKGKLGRHCDNYCSPAQAGAEDCAIGLHADMTG